MLRNVDPPSTHWLLKSPSHILWIDALLKYYPQASLIMSHRRLDEVIPSVLRFVSVHNSIYFNEDDSNSWKTMWQQTMVLFNIWVERLVEFRSRQPPPKNIFDIRYEDLVRDPIATVRRIYDHFDFLQWSDDFEKAMHTWLLDNPQGKQGRNSYSLQEFGIDKEINKELNEKYEKMFLLP